jgi:hypothetical protein
LKEPCFGHPCYILSMVVGWSGKAELDIIWKKASEDSSIYFFGVCPKGLRSATKLSEYTNS